MKQQLKHHGITVIGTIVFLAFLSGIFVYSGVYNIAADDPQSVRRLTVRTWKLPPAAMRSGKHRAA